MKNNTIRCKKLATIVSGRKNVARPFVRQKQVSTRAKMQPQRTRAYLFSPDEGSCYVFFDPKQLLPVSCILWCYFSKCYQIIPSNSSFWCSIVINTEMLCGHFYFCVYFKNYLLIQICLIACNVS